MSNVDSTRNLSSPSVTGACNTEHDLPLQSSITLNISDISMALSRVKDTISAGPDGLSPRLLKHEGSDLEFIITHLFNLSLECGVFPSQWKQTTIKPRFKSGPRNLCSSYRGIHHTPVLARALERCVKRPFLHHLLQNNFISCQQHGFLSRRSVNTCLLHMFSLWMQLKTLINVSLSSF